MIIRDLPFIWRLKDLPELDRKDPFAKPRFDRTPGVPATIDFAWDWDPRFDLLRQDVTRHLAEALVAIYAAGSANLGATESYGKEFLDMLHLLIGERRSRHPSRPSVMEIGPGTGWMAAHLYGYADYYAHQGKFPDIGPRTYTTGQGLTTAGPFDIVFAHYVLEHVEDPLGFLKAARDLVAPSGALVLAVPDCTREVATGDISMATPQHLSYFTQRSLSLILKAAGFADWYVDARGGTLYATAYRQDLDPEVEGGRLYGDHETFGRFFCRSVQTLRRVGSVMEAVMFLHGVGAYAPMRLFPYARPGRLRLFDDGMRGKYLDGVPQKIEGIEDFEAKPVDVMFVMSMTHERQIVEKLAGRCKIITLSEMLDV